ncbi:acylneuraminate cytidylyltransferase family protein [Oceaniserpentilla sp. 4NH20-0058]|uniref:acylneuraminate cytidylyltransferase family protein n=1 Tax=Oceaniserpentilla sp. 4NH20-0058 TaxID=3127660 RepID=UPI00310460BF
MIVNAFIFARGGSKGLPRKNVKKLNGKPLIVYSIESAKATSEINEIFVSTDDAEIANIAKDAGATIIERPSELAGDTSSEWLAWRHAITWVNENRGTFEYFVSLPPTAPLRSIGDVSDIIKEVVGNEIDIAITIEKATRSPFFNMVKKKENGMFELVIKPEETVIRRQDAPECFDITTVAYATTPEFVLKNNGIFDGRVGAVEVPKERAVDIDDIYDFMLAESILKINVGAQC